VQAMRPAMARRLSAPPPDLTRYKVCEIERHMFAIVAVVGIATLALPLSAHAGVRVSIGVGLPVVVAPAPVVVAPPPPAVVYPAPVVVAPPPVVYGSAPVVVGGYYGYHYRPWRHSYYRWHRW
jgi:hypothetical protein